MRRRSRCYKVRCCHSCFFPCFCCCLVFFLSLMVITFALAFSWQAAPLPPSSWASLNFPRCTQLELVLTCYWINWILFMVMGTTAPPHPPCPSLPLIVPFPFSTPRPDIFPPTFYQKPYFSLPTPASTHRPPPSLAFFSPWYLFCRSREGVLIFWGVDLQLLLNLVAMLF